MAKQPKNWFSTSLSNITAGASMGASLGPWGSIAGGILGGATTFVDYLFSGSDEEENKQSTVDQPIYTLTDEEREKEEFSWMKYAYPQRHNISSMFLTGANRR